MSVTWCTGYIYLLGRLDWRGKSEVATNRKWARVRLERIGWPWEGGRAPSLFMLFGCISISMASLMRRSLYLVFVERSLVSCNLMMWSRMKLCSANDDINYFPERWPFPGLANGNSMCFLWGRNFFISLCKWALVFKFRVLKWRDTTRETPVAGDQWFLLGVMIQISVLLISIISFSSTRSFVDIKVRKKNVGRRLFVRAKAEVTWVRRVRHETADMRIARMI